MPVSVGELLAYLRLDSSGFDRGIRVAQTEMRTATGAADRMGTAVGVTGERLTGAGRAAQVAASGSAKYRAAQLSLVAAQERYNAVLNQGNASTAKLASAEASVIRANERVAASSRVATSAVSQLAAAQEGSNAAAATTTGMLARTASGFTHAARSAVGLGAAFGAFELARKAIDISKEAATFDQSMTRISALTGASSHEINGMKGSLLALSGKVATAPDELATSLYHMKAISLPAAEALKAVEVAAKGAKIGNADLEETTNALTSTIQSGIAKNQSFSRTMSDLLTIVGTGDMKLSDFNESLGSGLLAIVAQYGVNLKEVGAAMATFGDNNIRGANAATFLRTAVQSIAVVAPKGQAQLEKLGIAGDQLTKDLESGGLNKAIGDLVTHLHAAGITGAKVGPVLTQIFTKRAGPGLAQLVGNFDLFQQKLAMLSGGAQTFDQRWAATTRTTKFAFQKLGAQVEAAGIALAEKLAPAAAGAANWLGTTLPHALTTLRDILAPLASLVGTVFAGAWHALAGVLSVAAGALAGVAGFLSHHKTLVTSVATAVLGMWAAYKAFTIGVAAIKAVDLALGALAMRMSRAGGAMAGMRGGMAGLSTASVAGGIALAGVGLAIAGVTAAHQQHARVAAMDKAIVDGYTQAIEADSGALGANTRAQVEHNLVSQGAYQTALKLGITQATLTNAVMGNAAAYKQVTDAVRASNASDADRVKLGIAVIGQSELLKRGTRNAKDMAAANKDAGKAAKQMGSDSATAATGVTQVQTAEQKATEAAQRLDNALKALSGQLSSSQALDQYRQSLQQLKSNLDKNNHSIRGNSTAAVANRLAVDNAVQGVFQYADALKAQGKTQPQIAAAMRAQIQTLIANARQYGLNKKELVAYLRTLGLTPKQIGTKLTLDDGAAKAEARAMLDWINGMRATIHVATVTGTKMSDPRLTGKASGGGLPEGVSAVGEQGPELAIKSGPNVHILSNPQSKAYLSATGMKAPGFAYGTLNPHAFQTSLGKDASSESYAFSQLLAIGTRAGISSGFAKQLTDENKHLLSAITDRNRLADKLGSDNQRLADAQKKLADEAATVHDAITGSFDVTSAGTGFDGQQPITGLNMLAEEKQDANRARAFVAAIKRLKGKIGAGYLYQLAEKGPSALAEAQALLSLNKSDLSAFNSAAASLNTSGNQLGSYIGGVRFGREVHADKAAVAADKARLRAENKSIDRLGDRILKQLENGIKHLSNPKINVYLDGKKIATAVAQGAKKNGARS